MSTKDLSCLLNGESSQGRGSNEQEGGSDLLGSYLASLTQMSAKCYMRSTKEIKLSAASIN